jgi:hypothetical protein
MRGCTVKPPIWRSRLASTRLRRAQEGAAKANIEQALTQIAALKGVSGVAVRSGSARRWASLTA